MSNLGSASVKGDPLLTFLFKLRFSSALRDGIGVFKLALVPLWVGFFRIFAMTAILCTTIISFTVDNYLFFFRILAMTTTTEFLCAAISYNVVN